MVFCQIGGMYPSRMANPLERKKYFESEYHNTFSVSNVYDENFYNDEATSEMCPTQRYN